MVPGRVDDEAIQAYADAIGRLLLAHPGPDVLQSVGILGVNELVVLPDWDSSKDHRSTG
jgi:hypothetical protein